MKKRLILLLLCILCICTACGKPELTEVPPITAAPTEEPTAAPTPEPTPEAIPFTEAYLMLSEPEAFGRLVDTYALTTEYQGVTYWFSKKQADAEALLKQYAAQCELLDAAGYDTSGLLVYIFPNGSDYSDSAARAVHLNAETVGTPEAIRVTLGAILGDYTNAGYLYALSQKICGTDADASPDANAFLQRPELLNLVSPCFTDPYVDGEALTACQALSLRLLNGMDDPYAGEEAFLKERDTYAGEIGADFVPTTVRYAYNSKTCPVRAQTYDMEIFLTPDYPEYTLPGYPDLHFDPLFAADTMIRFFDVLDAQSKELCRLFRVEKGEYLPVRMTDSYDDGGETGGWFSIVGNQPMIIARMYFILRHEYVHYMYYRSSGGWEEDDLLWCNEALAYWYGRIDMFEIQYLYAQQSPYSTAVWAEFLGEAFDTPEDYVTYCNICARWILDTEGRNALRYDLKKPLGGNKESFGGYFIETYGEQAFIDCMVDPTQAEILFGKTVDEIVEDWMDWLPPLTDKQREIMAED
ncbi:MAG: hypothetical protein IJL62_02090 [Clostridia bacterium]|nr:hypothetical protein [Clostridia bacterium]